jgi:hypothetical protein
MRALGTVLLCPLLLATGPAPQARSQCTGSSSGKTPLIDLVGGTYQGFPGGLYPGNGNTPPPAHLAAALARADQIAPLDETGQNDPVCGKIVMLSIGMSNTFHEFAQFERQEDIDPGRNERIVILNGAQGGKSAGAIRNPADPYWNMVANRLAALGVSEQQVQVVWLEELNENPPDDFPGHAQVLRDDLEAIVQILQTTFPNLQLCYLSDRSYGGYTSTISPEPQAYETGFAVQWLIDDQIQGVAALNHDPANGAVMAPLLLWGPYLWADGILPNSLGTRWCACDFENCGNVHPSVTGEKRVADLLSRFFAHDVTTQAWYPSTAVNTGAAWRDAEADAYVVADDGDANFGSATTLRSDTNPLTYTYARFDVSGVQRPVLHAKLSFRNPQVNLSADAREVRIVPDSNWNEHTIPWNNRPLLGNSLGVIPRATRDGTRSIDVTAAVNADPDGVITFALTTTAAGEPASLVTSREGGAAPRLVMMRGSSEPVVYCTSGVSASGCRARIGAQGIASASAPKGFWLTAQSVEKDKSGIFFYGTNGRQATPWGNGSSLRCVAPPVRRGGLMNASGSTETCSGTFALDLNARWCPTCPRPGHNPGPGALVNAQLWYRDPQNTSNQTTSMSDAVEFTVCP